MLSKEIKIYHGKEERLFHYEGEDRVVSSHEFKKELDEAKEKPIMSFKTGIPTLDKLTEGFETGELVIVTGQTGMGKCLAKGTKLLKADGSVIKVEKIQSGELLMGDDGLPRTVLSTTKGKAQLYKIEGENGNSYIVNHEHILSLKKNEQIIDIPLYNYLEMEKTEREKLKGWRTPIYGRKNNTYNIMVKQAGIGPYYGFELDGNGRFLLADGTVTHNTSLLQSFTLSFEKQGANVLWFSYEMTARQFFSKFPGLPLFYLPRQTKERALDWIEDRIIEGKVKYDTRIVMIDHLHFLVDLVKMKNPSLEIGTIVRSLKTLALKYNIVLFLIAHTSMPKSREVPGLEAIRDSSFISQEADIVLVIHRIPQKGNTLYGLESVIGILKHRRMGTIGKRVKVLYQNKQFTEIEEEL